jgi:hypothetical protein
MVDDQALKFRAQNATTGFLNSAEKRKVANRASLLTFLKQGQEVHESGSGTSCHFTAGRRRRRFGREADIDFGGVARPD